VTNPCGDFRYHQSLWRPIPAFFVARLARAGNALGRPALAPTSAGMIFRLRTEVQGIVTGVLHRGRGEPSAWTATLE
jgi:hypothetical protein